MPAPRTAKPFHGREAELAELEAVAQKPGAKLVVIKGRRRVGKSRLAREFGKRHPEMSFYYLTGLPPSELSGPLELQHMASRMSKLFKIPPLRPKNWDELLWHLGDRLSGGNAILVLDEINWLGRSDKSFSTLLWALWEETLSHLENFVLILSGSLAGWIDDKVSGNRGYVGRISKNMTLDELPIRDSLAFFGNRRTRISLHEQLQVVLVTGGIPRYLEEIDPRLSAEKNIHDLCFTSSGLLFLEYDQLMNDLFQRSNRVSRQIIEAVAETPLTLEGLRKKLRRSRSGKLSKYVEDLEKAGFLMRHHSWDTHTGKTTKEYKIRVIDNYARFYLKAIKPHATKINSGLAVQPSNLDGLLGLQFENLVLKNRALLFPAMGISPGQIVKEGPYFQERTIRRAGCQIDYLVQTRRSLYVVEIKFLFNPVPLSIIDEVQKKIDGLQTPDHRTVRPVLVHVNGVADSVIQEDFFDKIIDFGALATQ